MGFLEKIFGNSSNLNEWKQIRNTEKKYPETFISLL